MKSSLPFMDLASILETSELQQKLQLLVEDVYRRGYQDGIVEALVELAHEVEGETELEVRLALYEPIKPMSSSATARSTSNS